MRDFSSCTLPVFSVFAILAHMIIIDGLSLAMQNLLQWYLGFSAPLVALALLSLSVFVFMLPLYHFGDKLLVREKQRKALLQAELDSIQELSGQRKYFYTKEIYRRYGYNPLYSLIGLFGLVLQLPFFVAAYQMLGHFGPFDGLAASPFTDLQQPDALLPFWGLTLNLMPLLMTLVNLLSAYFYAESPEEKRKIWVFPALFLVLLYDQPVALVFYWTMNNVCSLTKNLWQARKRSVKTSLQEKLAQFDHAWRSANAVHIGLLLFALLLGLLYFLYTDRDREIPSLWVNSSLVLLFYLGLYFGRFRFFTDSLPKPAKWRRWLWAALLTASFAGFLVLAVLGSAQAQNLQDVLKIREKILLLRPFVLLLEIATLLMMLPFARLPTHNLGRYFHKGRTPRRGCTQRLGRKCSQQAARLFWPGRSKTGATHWPLPEFLLAYSGASRPWSSQATQPALRAIPILWS